MTKFNQVKTVSKANECAGKISTFVKKRANKRVKEDRKRKKRDIELHGDGGDERQPPPLLTEHNLCT